MSESPEDRKLEDALRRWGADRAAAEAPTGRAPIPGARRAAPSRRRWVPAAVAAALLLATGGLFVGAWWGPPGARSDAGGGDEAAVASLEERLDAARRDLADLRARLTDTREQATQASEALAERTGELERARQRIASAERRAGELTERLAEAKGEAERLSTQLADREEAVRSAEADSQRLAERIEAREAELAAAREEKGKIEKSLAAIRQEFAAETARLRKMHDAAVAETRQLQRDLLAARARRQAAEEAFRTAYVARVRREGGDGLEAWRDAAVDSDLLDRAARLRKAAGDAATRRLIERTEALLTRLTLLDVNDYAAMRAFGEAVERSGVPDEIDEALAAGARAPELRAWLLESKLVLEGAARVG